MIEIRISHRDPPEKQNFLEKGMLRREIGGHCQRQKSVLDRFGIVPFQRADEVAENDAAALEATRIDEEGYSKSSFLGAHPHDHGG